MLISEAGVHQTSERYFLLHLPLHANFFTIQRAVDITFVIDGIHSAIGQKLRWRVIITEILCCF